MKVNVTITFLLALAALCISPVVVGKAVPLVLPEGTSHGFELQKESLDIFSKAKGKIAVTSVIGPYRSGKSFLLNQLLGLQCDQGFGVGHTRDAQTKGVWVWDEPLQVKIKGETVSVFFIDTEGLQSGGRAQVYDDRVFALSAMLSSLLIYNLPETVKTTDLEKLSFAVTLADEFLGNDVTQHRAGAVEGGEGGFRGECAGMPSMLWLIQRDFLESSLEDTVRKQLAAVDNPDDDPHIEQINRIRNSMKVFKRHEVFGLVQPHLQRAKLCELQDSQLEKQYVTQRDALRSLVKSLAGPRLACDGKTMTGPEFSTYLATVVGALNANEIPTAANVVEVFNKDRKEESLKVYTVELSKLAFPINEDELAQAHTAAMAKARDHFARHKFGRSGGIESEMFDAVYTQKSTSNAFRSLTVCESLFSRCGDTLDTIEEAVLPSMRRFDGATMDCKRSFITTCRGPSNATFSDKLDRLVSKRTKTFQAAFNQSLSNHLALGCLFGLFVFRFIFPRPLGELICTIAFVVLGFLPQMMVGGAFYQHQWWIIGVSYYETVVYNDMIDLNRWLPMMTPIVVSGSVLFYLFKRFRKRATRGAARGNDDIELGMHRE